MSLRSPETSFNPTFLPDHPVHRWLNGCALAYPDFLSTVLKVYSGTREGPNNFDGIEREFAQRQARIAFDNLGWAFEVENSAAPHNPGDRYVYLANHPTITATFPWLDYMSRTFAPNTAYVAKATYVENPIFKALLGRPLEIIGKARFVKRDDNAQAIAAVNQAIQELLKPDTGLVLFPDAHRPYPSRIEKEKEKWKKKVPDVEEWMHHTPYPRSGGVMQMLKATQHMKGIRFLNSTLIEPQGVKGTYYLQIEEVTPKQMAGAHLDLPILQSWLDREWRRKNQLIKEHLS